MKNKEVLVIQDDDNIIGVASTTQRALEIIKDYYGKDAVISDIVDIRDSGLEFTCNVFEPYHYHVVVRNFTIDDLY